MSNYTLRIPKMTNNRGMMLKHRTGMFLLLVVCICLIDATSGFAVNRPTTSFGTLAAGKISCFHNNGKNALQLGSRISLTPSPASATCSRDSIRHNKLMSMEVTPFASADLKAEADGKDDPLAQYKVGVVVRIVAEGLKAYQVSPKGYGSYNDADKQFVPAENSGDRKTKNLAVPVGLRGVITKIYGPDDVSANFPLQVKFEPGKHTEEGFDAPVPFLFHLAPGEVEIV